MMRKCMVPFIAVAINLALAFVSTNLQHNVPEINTRHTIMASSDKSNSNLDSDRKCKFGRKSYWDAMYEGEGDRPSKSYSWYCDWNDLVPFWTMLVPKKNARVLIAGIGNDPTPIDIYDNGWRDMIAFDYSEAGLRRAEELFGPGRDSVRLMIADARNLPIPTASIDATLDKGMLDAIYITGEESLKKSIKELIRVTAEGGVFVCLSRVMVPEELLENFEPRFWDVIHDGSMAFAPDGEATIDLGAELYSWRRTVISVDE